MFGMIPAMPLWVISEDTVEQTGTLHRPGCPKLDDGAEVERHPADSVDPSEDRAQAVLDLRARGRDGVGRVMREQWLVRTSLLLDVGRPRAGRAAALPSEVVHGCG
jgi:hypothetical protein